jgi:hypothetical protein
MSGTFKRWLVRSPMGFVKFGSYRIVAFTQCPGAATTYAIKRPAENRCTGRYYKSNGELVEATDFRPVEVTFSWEVQ